VKRVVDDGTLAVAVAMPGEAVAPPGSRIIQGDEKGKWERGCHAPHAYRVAGGASCRAPGPASEKRSHVA